MQRPSSAFKRWPTIAFMAAVMMLPAPVTLAADGDDDQCMAFEFAYEVRPEAARSIIGQEVEAANYPIPEWMVGLEATVSVDVSNGPSVHLNNYMVITTNGISAPVYGTETSANGSSGLEMDATLGADLTLSYVIGPRARGDVPGVEGASVSATVTVCTTAICLAADQDATLFQIGVFDPVDDSIPGGWKPYYGAAEFPANDEFASEGVTFTVAETLDPNPDFPGYLAPMRMSEILAANPNVEQDRPLTDAAPRVTIVWTQCLEASATFYYARYGSESDDVTLDGVTVAEPVSQEGILITEIYDLGVLAPGTHELTIAYVGGGRGDGHYIDALRLETTPNT